MTDEMDAYESAVKALGEGARTEDVEELVALMDDVRILSILKIPELAKVLVDAGPKLRKGLAEVFELAKGRETIHNTPAGEAMSAAEGSSLEALFDVSEQRQPLEDLLQNGLKGSSIKDAEVTFTGACLPGCSNPGSSFARTYRDEQGMRTEQYCDDCGMMVAVVRSKQSALSAADAQAVTQLKKDIAALQAHYAEQNPYSEFALSGKSIEEILEGGQSIEEILGEAEA